MENAAIVSDPGSSLYLPGHSKPYDPRAAADAQESMKAKLIAIRRKLVEQVRAKPPCLHRGEGSVEPPHLCVRYVTKSFSLSFFLGGERTRAPQGGARVLFEEMMEGGKEGRCFLLKV